MYPLTRRKSVKAVCKCISFVKMWCLECFSIGLSKEERPRRKYPRDMSQCLLWPGPGTRTRQDGQQGWGSSDALRRTRGIWELSVHKRMDGNATEFRAGKVEKSLWTVFPSLKKYDFGSWSGQSTPSSQSQRLSAILIHTDEGLQEPTVWN